MKSEVLTTKEAAAYLKLNFKTVQRLVKNNLLVGVKIGNHYRISKQAIDNFLNQRPADLATNIGRV